MWPFDRRNKREQDLARELQSHLDLEAEEQRAAGLNAEEARYAAKRAFGNQTLARENIRATWGLTALESLTQDLRYAFRSLRASPVFTCVAVASLALGIGANTAIFSFVDALLLKRLPVPEPERLVTIAAYNKGVLVQESYSYPAIKALDERNHVFDGVFSRFPLSTTLSTGDLTDSIDGEMITGGYFRTLRLKPALGRLLNDDDVETAAGNPVCVISYRLWQTRFGADPHVLGLTILLNSHPYKIVGVTEKGFFGSRLQSRSDIEVPLSRAADFAAGPFGSMLKSPRFLFLVPVARLRPGVTVPQAEATLAPIVQAIWLELADPKFKPNPQSPTIRCSDASQGANPDHTYLKPVVVLMGVVGLVLLIACANIANLLLARAGARSREFAVRLSLGASRARLIRQLMVENLLLAANGGVLGLGLAYGMIRILLLFLNAGQTAGSGIQATLSPVEIAFAMAICFVATLLFGLAPAWQSARQEIAPDLQKLSSQAKGARTRKSLIVAEIALSMVILFAGGLFTRTLGKLRTVELGFDPAHVFAVSLNTNSNYAGKQAEQRIDEVLDRLRGQPWVMSASSVLVTPLEGAEFSEDFTLPGHASNAPAHQTNLNIVGPGYFQTMSQKLILGRDFNDADAMTAPHVAIVDQQFVKQFMPGENPLGQRIKMQGQELAIVGLVRDSAYLELREQRSPLVYESIKQTQNYGSKIVVRTNLPPPRASAAIEKAVHSVDSKLAAKRIEEMQEIIDQGMTSERILTFLANLFSALVTLLCSIGIYGLIAYAVARRTREIGVRFAIGAQKSDVAKLFFRDGFVLIALGLILGIPLALASARALKSLLYGVEPTDPLALSLAIGIFLTAGIVASLLPVRKATRIEPAQALRYE